MNSYKEKFEMDKIKLMNTRKMTICLWFDGKAEEAAHFYTQIFSDSSIGRISRFFKEGKVVGQKSEGDVMVIEFSLNGMNFIGLNGGSQFKFNEATSIVINCETQEEINYYWDKLTTEGEEGPCGWLKDKFGVSWQVVPTILPELMSNKDPEKVKRVTAAFMKMKKFEIQKLIDA